MVQIEENFQTK